MTAVTTHDLITYVDSNAVDWQEVASGARRKELFQNPETGQRTVLVQWDAGYQVPKVDHHLYGEYLYILGAPSSSAPSLWSRHLHPQPAGIRASAVHARRLHLFGLRPRLTE